MKSLTLLLIVGCTFSLSASEPAGAVKSMVGSVETSAARTPGWKAARPGCRLFVQDQLRTGEESSAEVQWTNGGMVRIAEKSSMTVAPQPKGQPGAGPEIKVLSGRIWANMKKITSSGKEFGIETPTATAAIRGTVFRVDVGTDSSTDVLVYEGKVAVGPAGAREKGLRPAEDTAGRHEVEGPSEVEGPEEVTLNEWITIVAGQQIRVENTGAFRTWKFNRTQDSRDAWVRYNMKQDSLLEKK